MFTEHILKREPGLSAVKIVSPVKYKPISKAWIFYAVAGSALTLSLVLMIVKGKKKKKK